MKTAIATRFRRGSPLSDLFPHTFMFTTFILQYLNELVEGEFRYFTPPQAFHTLKVQCLTVRTFLLTIQCFVEMPKFVQGLFQRLRVVYFLTRAKSQVSR